MPCPYVLDIPEIFAHYNKCVEEEKIQEYINRIKELKMSYMRFEANSILWLCETVNGEKIIYLKSNLARAVNEIDILPQDFLMVAKALITASGLERSLQLRMTYGLCKSAASALTRDVFPQPGGPTSSRFSGFISVSPSK